MATWHNIYLSKTGGSELDIDGWRELMELCPFVHCDETAETLDEQFCLVGGVIYDTGIHEGTYTSDFKSYGALTLEDPTKERYALSLNNFLTDDTAGERYNCIYVRWSDDYKDGQITIDGRGGLQFYRGNLIGRNRNYWRSDNTSEDSAIKPQQIINGISPTSTGSDSATALNNSGLQIADYFTLMSNIPLFLRDEDARYYVETGERRNCISEVQSIADVGGDYNKYCQTTIFSMKPNGHDKAELYKYYYTYKMSDRQNIVGYIADDTNPQNVRFKAKNLTEQIAIIDEYTGETFFVSGYDFNHNFYGQSFGCSTKREHELFGGNICWGVFGRMNIYIFDSEEKADDYLENDDPSKALNYDDIDNYDERNANKTGEDAGDQNSQNNALVQGWAEPSLSNVYILNSTTMGQVAELVFPDVTTSGELPDQIKELKASLGLYGENPINDIIDVWHCPFNPYNLVERDNKNLWFGSYRSSITATHVTAHGKLSNFGSCTINPIYNDFRDYDIEITLYLPYFGAVDLAPDIFMGKTLNIKVTADLRSHNVRYYIFADQTLIQYHDCAVGTCYPLMGQDVAGKANQVMHAYNTLQTAKRNTALTMGVNALGMTAQLARGDIMGAVNTGVNNEQTRNNVALQEKQLAQDVKYTQPARSVVGNASPACSENDIPYPYIIFKIPQTIKPPLLQSTYGLPCNVITQLANVHGYVQIDNIQLRTSAPERIKADIIRRLQSGVYLT